MKNFWNEFEYNKLKLLLHKKKVDSVFDVLNRKKAYDEMFPVSVELHLTDICNLRCSWCTDKELRSNRATNDKASIFSLFETLSTHRVGVTIEGGGEPTLHPDFSEITLHGKKLGLHMGLITNGVKDCSDVIRHFKWVRVSIDSTGPEEYLKEKGVDRFDTVLANLKKYSKKRNPEKTHLGVGYVLTSRNIERLADFVEQLDSIGVDYIYIRPVEEAAEITPDIERILKLKAKLLDLASGLRLKTLLHIQERLVKNNDSLPCVAHSLSCIIQANGTVALCEKRRHDPLVLGYLKKKSFEEIWNSAKRKRASRKLLNPKVQVGCDTCRITSFNRVFFDVNQIHTSNFI